MQYLVHVVVTAKNRQEALKKSRVVGTPKRIQVVAPEKKFKITIHVKEVAALGDDAVLLCFEGKGKFCHRHLAAEWLRSGGIDCEELP